MFPPRWAAQPCAAKSDTINQKGDTQPPAGSTAGPIALQLIPSTCGMKMTIASIGGCQIDTPYLELPQNEARASFFPKRGKSRLNLAFQQRWCRWQPNCAKTTIDGSASLQKIADASCDECVNTLEIRKNYITASSIVIEPPADPVERKVHSVAAEDRFRNQLRPLRLGRANWYSCRVARGIRTAGRSQIRT